MSQVTALAIAPAPTVSMRVRALQTEARALAREHIAAFQELLKSVEEMAVEIADGGESYPAGVREVARRVAEDMEAKANTIQVIAQRA